MNVTRSLSLILQCSVMLAITYSLGGCFLAPGMRLDAAAPDEDQRPVGERADIFAITPSLLKRLADEQQSEDDAQQTAKGKLFGVAPKFAYRIGARDVLRIIVWDHPELNLPSGSSISQTQTLMSGGGSGSLPTSGSQVGESAEPLGREVDTDGTVFFPYVGVVHVEGKTTQEVRQYLTKALVKTIRDPQVDVAIQVYRSARMYVSGEVKNPGLVPISNTPLTLLDAISASGGPTDNADLSHATLSRSGTNYDLDLYALFYKGNSQENLELRNGDMVNVPEKRANKIFILGEIGIGPGPALSLPVPRGTYSLSEAISDAGGINQITANASHVYVIRGTADRPTIFHLNAKSPDALVLADAFKLRPRDVVYVDASNVTRFNRVLSQILPTASLLQTGASVASTSR